MTEKLEYTVQDAISFIEWRDIKEIKKITGVKIPQIRKELKVLIDYGYLLKRGEKYKYDSA